MMIPCKDCGKMKSDSSGRCPHCGARHDYGGLGWALAVIFALGMISVIFQCGK